MTTRRDLLLMTCTAVGVLCLPEAAVADGPESLAVVIAKDNPLKDLSTYELKRLFLGDQMNGPGGKLVPLNRSAKSDERLGFDHNVLGMSSEEAARYWIDRRIRGQSGAPKSVDPAAVVQRVVTRLSGAISYVRHSELSTDVKVVSIDGRLPGDHGYRIRTAPPSRSVARGPLALG